MQSGVSALESLMDGARSFLGWWLNELWGIVPPPVRRLFADAEPHLVLCQVEAGFQIDAEGASRARLDAAGTPTGAPTVLSRAQAMSRLAEIAEAGTAAAAGIRLPLSQCFARRVELPRAARKDVRQILNLDLERATPFRLKDVYTAYVIYDEAGPKGKLRLRQLVAKRELVDPLIADVKAAGLDVAFVDCWHDTPSSGLSANFLVPNAPTEAGAERLVTLPRALAALALLLIVSTIVLTLSRYATALAEVQAQTARMRTQAAAVRSVLERSDTAVADLGRLKQLRLKQIPAIEVVEEMSRLLPDSVWLADLRIEGDTLDISGLAKSGAALPPLIERSDIFADAALTAPLTLDQREDKERFSLRVRIRQSVGSQLTSKAGGQQ